MATAPNFEIHRKGAKNAKITQRTAKLLLPVLIGWFYFAMTLHLCAFAVDFTVMSGLLRVQMKVLVAVKRRDGSSRDARGGWREGSAS